METVTKPGYKHTELGWIPEDWDLRSYCDLFSFLSTATYSRADLQDDQEIRYIHYGDIHTKYDFHLDILNSNLPSISNNKLKAYSLLQEGDLVMADASEDYDGVGKSIEINNVGNRKVISGLHTFLLRDYHKRTASGFKGYLHANPFVKKQFYELATGMKVFGVSKNNLKKVFIPLPPLHEQTAIATALSDMDRYISSLEALIAKKRLIKQGAMQELLTPKEDWEMRKFGEVFNISGGYSASRDQLSNEGYCYLHYGDIHGSNKSYVNVENEYGNIPKLNIGLAKISSKSLLKNGDIVFVDASEDMDGVSKFIVVENHPEIPFISGLHTIVAKSKTEFLDLNYKKYCFQAKYIKEQFQYFAVGTKVSGVSKSSVKQIDLYFPKMEEQIEIGKILSSMDNEIHNINNKLSKALLLKQGMMQELLTGRTRLI
ncbi:type I restriction enzyme, S subunit [Algoriphagus locisalis]|uniref:Type I restriction enzyme, S subunit n=1 Tax=Algoriphagus locisalis TaxID=305507 RepID=A0A1I7CB37_9BACT|nr:restriction endonuclease subunit S [Algoriphagus locisalis]SFT96617.1 type I restriction enzyme, S subunit [Algoriphagus locisalis]